MKIVTVLGARPQFIKASVVSRALLGYGVISEVIIHTGQHFDKNMSEIFFEEMAIPKPKYNLNINSLNHGAMTGRMLEEIEKILLTEEPDMVMVYGDTNSTFAGALAAKKLHIKVVHVEAGLRSFNMGMPEEINRILTDRISDILFCPTLEAVKNLKYEHIQGKIIKNGDVMQDCAHFYKPYAKKPELVLEDSFVLVTFHRAENTDDWRRLKGIIDALNEIAASDKIVLPLHPRTKKILAQNDLKLSKNITVIEPVGYLEMIYLLEKCKCVMTDSGGLQKEAFFFKKECITLRDETEWVELVDGGYNTLTGSDKKKIMEAYHKIGETILDYTLNLYGNGEASQAIAKELVSFSQ